MIFNLNDYVYVQLNDLGRQIHRERFERFCAVITPTKKLIYTPPKEDTEGWSKWQMWELMELFGPYIGLGKLIPFIHAEIKLPDPARPITSAANDFS